MLLRSWVAFPVLFAVGAEGFGGLGADGSALAHAIADLVAKNLYSYASCEPGSRMPRDVLPLPKTREEGKWPRCPASVRPA